LKTQLVGEAASVVSAIPRVREALVNFQRQFAADRPARCSTAAILEP
jgi:cytidylate kinase